MHFPPREQFQRSLRSWGVNSDSTLVLYDDAHTALLSRLYFLLDLYGFDMSQVKVLAGGSILGLFCLMPAPPTSTPDRQSTMRFAAATCPTPLMWSASTALTQNHKSGWMTRPWPRYIAQSRASKPFMPTAMTAFA